VGKEVQNVTIYGNVVLGAFVLLRDYKQGYALIKEHVRGQ